MKYKYGEYSQEQLHDYKKKLHSVVHWLLIYAEEKSIILDEYFVKVQYRFDGLNELLGHPSQLVEISNLIESAKLEYKKEDYNYSIYRKSILDIHDLIDDLPEV